MPTYGFTFLSLLQGCMLNLTPLLLAVTTLLTCKNSWNFSLTLLYFDLPINFFFQQQLGYQVLPAKVSRAVQKLFPSVVTTRLLFAIHKMICKGLGEGERN